ncbi:hypothetical protein B0A49_05518 [Cryomyces minteri]|uniref:Choline kinase N-terminal domain-containing protein n=1 Tax=Cryomyces minteri TaxID=331657 RepID=A0A4U0X8W2_9PEZI|nr:hypothetical protein B0A49_05518 [Cryomyces minteri]
MPSASGPSSKVVPGANQTLFPAIVNYDGTASPRSGPTKVVSIAAEPESISPMMRGNSKDVDDFDLDRGPKQHRAKGVKRLSGRPPMVASSSSLQALTKDKPLDAAVDEDNGPPPYRHQGHGGLLASITAWLHDEKTKRAARKWKRRTSKSAQASASNSTPSVPFDGSIEDARRRSSDASDGSMALDKLEQILKESLIMDRPTSRKGSSTRISSIRKLRRQSTAGSSDTDYQDGDAVVPTTDAWLDNTRTLAYTGGATDSSEDLPTSGRATPKAKEAWTTFKFEILRLAHTLRLKGWRRVPLEMSSEIEVERLSGALTNAVYVVSPPKELPPRQVGLNGGRPSLVPKTSPPKLLLRIYGPQVEHLIDREAELLILRRLARKRIGPRLLGTFGNGRFEEFFHARTLTAHDLRVPETSKQIAKRMRELHDGIELLQQERDDGASVWRNWDKWVQRVEEIVSWIDSQIIDNKTGSIKSAADAWKSRGLVCGVEWPIFRQTVERYRKWLDEQYGGIDKVREQLVFSHNDTQYGNILRLVPAGESPLLLPANEHKQLVVIDFEYANANLRGIEFANHFTEWCYNYHDADKPHGCNTAAYPTPDEQARFIGSYVRYRPQFHPSASITPSLRPQTPATPSLSAFTLDSRAPPAQMQADEARESAAEEAEIARLMHETRLWRLANSAQWVAWGIVQAKVPGMPGSQPATPRIAADGGTDPLEAEEQRMKEDLEDKRPEEQADDAEFDYLGYAQERAMFFWGDALGLGIVRDEDLPRELLRKVKVVRY